MCAHLIKPPILSRPAPALGHRIEARKLGLTERLNAQEIRAAWREILGEFLAERSLPISVRDGVLTVQVIQPAVRYELDCSWKRNTLRKLQARFGARAVREVRFRG